MGIVASIAYVAVFAFLLLLLLRIALEMIRSYSPEYRPAGAALVAFETVYTLTDPPVKALRRLIPPLRLGAVALDMSVLVIFFVCSILMSLLAPFVI